MRPQHGVRGCRLDSELCRLRDGRGLHCRKGLVPQLVHPHKARREKHRACHDWLLPFRRSGTEKFHCARRHLKEAGASALLQAASWSMNFLCEVRGMSPRSARETTAMARQKRRAYVARRTKKVVALRRQADMTQESGCRFGVGMRADRTRQDQRDQAEAGERAHRQAMPSAPSPQCLQGARRRGARAVASAPRRLVWLWGRWKKSP